MRDLLDLLKLYEAPSNNLPNVDEIEAFKKIIAGRIKQLPDNDNTAKETATAATTTTMIQWQ